MKIFAIAVICGVFCLGVSSASVIQSWVPADSRSALDWISDNSGQVFWLRDPDSSTGVITATPSGSITLTNTKVISSVGGGFLRSGYQSLVLGSIASGSFVSLWELSNVPLVSSHPPQRVGDFFTQGGTTFSYRDEIILTDELSTAFNEPEDLRLVVTMADGSNVFRALEITPIPEPSITLLALASLCILGMRKRRSNR